MERRIVAQLLNGLDSLNQKSGGNQVLVIRATNRADSLNIVLRLLKEFLTRVARFNVFNEVKPVVEV